ncbi:catalase family protein [Paludisphaera sp.]|uniref:catalase family protein n=1 Tax=Paludisphaera sp. TaxID=2017432 RepID=UPI00301D4F01
MSRDAKAAPGREASPEGEERAIARIVEVETRLLERKVADEGLGVDGRPVPRSQHPKQHGAVRAEFVVRDDVPEHLRRGLFAEPGRRFPAWIRFSNAIQKDDRLGGGHGMAIKLMDVPGARNPDGTEGTTHDLVLLDFPRFAVRDAIEVARLQEARLGVATARFRLLSRLPMALFLVGRPRTASALFQMMRRVPTNPMAATYWSTTPYKLGEGAAVKYVARPVLDGPVIEAEESSPDQLREAMARHLSMKPARYDFLVQPQLDPDAQPIEDASVEWDEERFPPVPVATIEIAANQPFGRWMDFCENLEFSPARCRPDHEPLGGINRARRATYLAISRLRHDRNRVPRVEPTPETDPERSPGPAA